MDVAIIFALIVALALPAPADRVVLLPAPDGKVGAISVRTADGERLLDRAWAGVVVDSRGGLETVQENAAEVRERYAAALAAQPLRPVSYIVYFLNATDELAAESVPVMDQVKAELARRPAAEIVAIGHTDRVGSDTDNDALALARAEAVRKILREQGVSAPIDAVGRGEREPLMATADGVAEPRNRRVEISIR